MARLWREVHARSGESLERAWEHANEQLVVLVGGKSMAGYAQPRAGAHEGTAPVFFSAAGCDLDARMAVVGRWMAEEVRNFEVDSPPMCSAREDDLLLRRVRRHLTDALGTPQTQLGAVARALGMSERNLQRCLREAGTSFRDLMDEVWELRARQLLSGTGLELTDIAFRLGYEQVSSFNRAFKRWTGKTPGELREEVGEAAGE